MKKIETYLPVFNGFYETLFTPDGEESEIEDINGARELRDLPEIDYSDCEWDYEEYNERVSQKCTEVIERELIDLFPSITNIEYQELVSPKYYNFKTDSINIEIEIKDLNEIIAYLQDNEEEFAEYIKDKYTSRDGFISSYSNDSIDWLFYLNNEEKLSHVLGSVLDFVFINEGYDTNDLYDGLDGANYITATNYDKLIKGE